MTIRSRAIGALAVVLPTCLGWACSAPYATAVASDEAAGRDEAKTRRPTTLEPFDGGGGGLGTGDASASSLARCEPIGQPGPLCAAGPKKGPSGTYTDYFLPDTTAGYESWEWWVNLDTATPNDGYFWSRQFQFKFSSIIGYFGIQANGMFRRDAQAPIERTPMLVFAIGAGALDARLGDIEAPNGMTGADFDGAPGRRIHVKFPWLPCRRYAFQVSKAETDGAGTWWRATIEDTASRVVTHVGDIQVPTGWGGLNHFSTVFLERFGAKTIVDCAADQELGSGVFGPLTANGGAVSSTSKNHITTDLACGNSRFTDLGPGVVRHEMGVPPGQ